MRPTVDKVEAELKKGRKHDDLVLFEKEPYKMMVLEELKKADSLHPITSNVSMITNL